MVEVVRGLEDSEESVQNKHNHLLAMDGEDQVGGFLMNGFASERFALVHTSHPATAMATACIGSHLRDSAPPIATFALPTSSYPFTNNQHDARRRRRRGCGTTKDLGAREVTGAPSVWRSQWTRKPIYTPLHSYVRVFECVDLPTLYRVGFGNPRNDGGNISS